jgi:hypothetical protein
MPKDARRFYATVLLEIFAVRQADGQTSGSDSLIGRRHSADELNLADRTALFTSHSREQIAS